MEKKFKYETILVNGPLKSVYAEFPFDSVKEFGTKKHVWVKIEVEGKSYSMNLLPNGKGGHWLNLKKEIRTKIGKEEGDAISISLERDLTPRTVEIPEYLQWLLDEDQTVTTYFEKMPISAKKFWIAHIKEPKNDDTRVERINRLFEYLRENYSGKK